MREPLALPCSNGTIRRRGSAGSLNVQGVNCIDDADVRESNLQFPDVTALQRLSYVAAIQKLRQILSFLTFQIEGGRAYDEAATIVALTEKELRVRRRAKLLRRRQHISICRERFLSGHRTLQMEDLSAYEMISFLCFCQTCFPADLE